MSVFRNGALPAVPTTQQVNKEALRLLVLQHGQREAARIAGLSENTVMSWARRYNWTARKTHAQPGTALIADSVEAQLQRDSIETKVGFSQSARRVAKSLATKSERALLDKDTAQAAKHWHGIASGVHGWEEKQAQANVMVNIALLGIDPSEIEVEGRTIEQTSNETDEL